MCNTPMQAKDSPWLTRARSSASFIVATLVAAFLGALFGYWFTIHEHKQEVLERRHTLIKLLNRELAQLPNTVQPYDKAKAFYRDPLRLIAPTKLIDGDTLQYHDDARLLEMLLNLNVVISRHNDFVQVTNLAQATTKDIPDSIHAQWYSDMKQRLAEVVGIRDALLKELTSSP
jgi:hypothetical protein